MMQTMVGDLVIHEVHHPGEIQKKILQILRDHGYTTAAEAANREAVNQQDNEEDYA